jgi:hypothetical protein
MIRTIAGAAMLLSLIGVGACAKPVVAPVADEHPTTPPPASADQAVNEGNGWTRTAPGTWTYSVIGDDENPLEKLGAEPGGRGIARYDLPDGAKGGEVSEIQVIYDSNGAGTWTIHGSGDNDSPSEAVLGTAPVAITDAEYMGWRRAAFEPAAPVTGTFYLFFESPDGALTVDAIQARGESHLMYQPPGGTAELAPYEPFVRVTLTNVY